MQAYKDIRQKFIEEYSKFNLSANMTASEKIAEVNKYDRLTKLTEMIVDNLAETNKQAINQINERLAGIYQTNYNALSEDFKKDDINIDSVNKSESKSELKANINPYNEIAIDTAKDKDQLKRKVKNSLLNSVLTTASVGGAFASMKAVYENNLKSSITIATTQATRIENLARQQAFEEAEKRAEENGLVLIKVWNTQEDSKVRDAHARANGQEAQVDKPFYVGGEKLMYPGDINGSAGNIINCRCYLTYKFVKK